MSGRAKVILEMALKNMETFEGDCEIDTVSSSPAPQLDNELLEVMNDCCGAVSFHSPLFSSDEVSELLQFKSDTQILSNKIERTAEKETGINESTEMSSNEINEKSSADDRNNGYNSSVSEINERLTPFEDDSDIDKTYEPENEESTSEDEQDCDKLTKKKKFANRQTGSYDQEENVELFQQSTTNKIWARETRKLRTKNMHSGGKYTNYKGKEVKQRNVQPLKECRKKCIQFLSEDVREIIFNEYWNLGSRDKRVSYVASCINTKETQVTRKRKLDSSKSRNYTNVYYFEINGTRQEVCKDCFCKTLDEKEKFIRCVIKNKSHSLSGVTSPDQRGRSSSANKKSEEIIDEVRKHISSFPQYESHYTRRTNETRMYLPSFLNLRKMYELYYEKVQIPVSRKLYEREFHLMNLHFKKPKVDTCHKCDILQMKIKVATDTKNEEEKVSAEDELKTHQERADFAYKLKGIDKGLAINDPEKKRCFTFDMQQCLPTPFLCSSVAFYKRQLWTFNVTVHDNATGQSTNYMWHEAIARRGANEVASCLYRHLNKLRKTVTDVTFYSDTCGGQNRNSHVAAMFMKAMADFQHLVIIDHKFLVAGHTHMECDVDHALIERKKKSMATPIYHPHDWFQLVRGTGKKSQFSVEEMSQDTFLDFAGLLKNTLVARKVDSDGEMFKWHDVQWLRYTKDEGVVYYKKSLHEDEPFKKLSFLRRGRKQTLGESVVSKSYTEDVKISHEKKKDILELLPLIPPVFHDFYKKLTSSHGIKSSDPDLENEDIE